MEKTGRILYVADTGNNRIQAFEGLMPPTYTISGTVRENSDRGDFLAGATVSVGGKTATTSDVGSYSITDLEAGTYTLVISKPGHLTRTVSGFVISGNMDNQDYYLTALYSIGGTVRHGSAGGPALAGATVAIDGKTATTNAAGSFSVTGIETGSYTVTISKSGYISKTISLTVNGNSNSLGFYLVPVYTLSGTLHEGSATGDGVAGATVEIAGKTATTGAAGSFTITEIPTGTYNVVISKTGYITKVMRGYLLDRSKSEPGLYLVPIYTISGTVRRGSASGAALPGAVVSIAGKTATTNASGAFSIQDIPAGTYNIAIYMSGDITKSQYVSKTVKGFVVNGNKRDLVFYLTPAYSMSGTVRQGSATGPVLAGATVAIAGKTATTSSTGIYHITGIPAGTYPLTISKTGFCTRIIANYAVSANRNGVTLYLTPMYSFSGTLRQRA